MDQVLRANFATWRVRGAALLAAVIAVVEWGSPLTNHLGYPAALIAAVAGSLIGCVVGAGMPDALRRRGVADARAGSLLAAAGLFGALLVAIFALLAAIRGMMTAECSPGRGAVFFLVLALPGSVLATSVGALIGAAIPRAKFATAAAVLVVPAFIVWSLLRFYNTPGIFAYDPFFGFYPGAIYDETISLSSALVTYRLGTLGAILAVGGLLAAGWDGNRWRITRVLRERSPATWAALAGIMVMTGVYLGGPVLGHRGSAAEVATALGGRIDGRRCIVLYARSIPARDVRLTRDDCDIRVAQIEAFYGVHMNTRITVFLFADAAQKQGLMGAADTYIAKPWRHEVYLQHSAFPHPVLKHELAHVVAGAMAPGPFHVTVRNGLIPLPGLIEGAAVAAAWEDEGDSTPHQWSRAMLEAGLTPSVEVLTGLGFYTHASGTAYTAAGSFSRWLIERYGAAKYRDTYRDGGFQRAYGRPLRDLEREWHAFLRTVEVPERLLARARTRFRRAAILNRTCPFESAEVLNSATTRLAAGQLAPARDDLAQVVRNDPTDVRARVALAEAYTRLGDVPHAVALAEQATRDLGPAAGARMRSRVADVVWRWRSAAEAREIYAGLDPELFDEDEARTLEVKRWAMGLLTSAPADGYAAPIQDLLAGRGELEPDVVSSLARLGLRFSAGPGGGVSDAMAGYLIGRQEHARHRHADAAELLASLDNAQLPTDRVRAETRRLRAVSLFMSGDSAAAFTVFNEISRDATRPRGARDMALDWIDRIQRIQAAR